MNSTRAMRRPLEEMEEQRKRKEVFDEFAAHSKALRESPSSYLVD